ncbi:MAG: tetraspanin family protein [Lachnospiraceae bacterium]|nr:tetraspanin family protein [Lachnospiraceae bacterium]
MDKKGSELVLEKIHKSAHNGMVAGIIFMVLFGPISLFGIFMTIRDGFHEYSIMFIFFVALLALGIFLFVFNKKKSNDPMSSSIIKRNPNILEMADELIENKVYQDQFLILSPRIIANATDITQISYTDEVFLVYVYIHRTNGVIDTKKLNLETAHGMMGFNIIRQKDDQINALMQNVLSHCRYSRAGYTPEGLAYANQMRELWKKDQAAKNGNPNA